MELDLSLRGGSQATGNVVSATPPPPLMATASSSQEDMMGTLILTICQKIQKTLLQTCQNSSNSCSSSTEGRSVHFNSLGPSRQSANTNQNQTYRNLNNNRYKNNQYNRYNDSANQQNNRYNSHRSTPNQQQNRNNSDQQPCTHSNRTNHQSRDFKACFNCGRLGQISRECRAPRRNQNKRQ